MDQLKETMTKIEMELLRLGFEKSKVKGLDFYKYKNEYYRIAYIAQQNAIVIEYANSLEDAGNEVLEDGDWYFLEDANMLDNLLNDIKKYYMN